MASRLFQKSSIQLRKQQALQLLQLLKLLFQKELLSEMENSKSTLPVWTLVYFTVRLQLLGLQIQKQTVLSLLQITLPTMTFVKELIKQAAPNNVRANVVPIQKIELRFQKTYALEKHMPLSCLKHLKMPFVQSKVACQSRPLT